MSARNDRSTSDDSVDSGAAASTSRNAGAAASSSASAGTSVASQFATSSEPPSAAQRKPRLALFIATAAGLGYLPKAPGTIGSLAGMLLSVVMSWFASRATIAAMSLERNISFWTEKTLIPGGTVIIATVIVAAAGVWASNTVAHHFHEKDPQYVVIDEVSGQQLTYLLAFAVGGNWRYLLLGFILFRLFDIWKPFPARQAESLPGGWGIMADDWIAGLYAAIGLWIARAAGL
jgi:phosphatidylglycerophosphatase A